MIRKIVHVSALFLALLLVTAAAPNPYRGPELAGAAEAAACGLRQVGLSHLELPAPMERLPDPEPEPAPAPEPEEPALPYTEEEIEMISAVVMNEVGHCSRASKLAVTHVILNRLEDGRFGDSIYEILHARGQFAAIRNYYTRRLPPDDACRAAVTEAMLGGDSTGGALYYCNPQYVGSEGARRWFDSLQVVLELDGQRYYK